MHFELLVLSLREAINLKGSKANFAIMHERLAHAGKEKVIQACRKAGIDIIEYNPPGYSGARYSLHGINAFTRFH
ncbi:hypothetical protein L249_5573 [Ophiocordyceps polyrhachis-furcata BCC 54312]|uniref:GAG-pre-integrase domain-containing protein n=1 Tax=Ophiocordyceps polyrhachis-furcata BCC 54312 TaxID=1330021 RepID=A0A367LGV7_9HYPO|nr:hypothetical protein L249_5573 [Ophiocordyceps polyrhachis-furcata BCC 54312]